MEAKEAPKSKFVYPDKLYARTNDNITLDISYAPQTLDAVEYVRTDAFIEKACSWLKENAARFSTESTMEIEYFVEIFKKEIRGYVYGLRKKKYF